MPEPLQVRSVCTADICRSPAIERIARDGHPNADMTPPLPPTLAPGAADGFRSRHLPAAPLAEAAGRRRTPSSPGHDVADPYRRGKAAAVAATGTITAMLSVVVPRLVGDR